MSLLSNLIELDGQIYAYQPAPHFELFAFWDGSSTDPNKVAEPYAAEHARLPNPAGQVLTMDPRPPPPATRKRKRKGGKKCGRKKAKRNENADTDAPPALQSTSSLGDVLCLARSKPLYRSALERYAAPTNDTFECTPALYASNFRRVPEIKSNVAEELGVREEAFEEELGRVERVRERACLNEQRDSWMVCEAQAG